MKPIYTALTLLTSLSLISCSTVSNYTSGNSPDKQYKTAQASDTNLQGAKTAENKYEIPTVPQAQSQDVSAAPPGSQIQASTQQPAAPATSTTNATAPTPNTTSSVASNTNQVAKMTSGGLLIAQNYSQAWQSVGKALSSSGYQIMEKDASLGTYYVVDKASTGGKVKRDTPIYQVRVQNSGSSSVVTLLNSQNQPADSTTSNRILGSIRDKIS